MKMLLVLVLLLTAAIMQPGGPAKPDQLIIGTWKHTLSKYNCTEIFTYRAGGKLHVTSGEEVADSTYVISQEPTPNGFYKLTDTLIADNGKKDCTGHVTPVGDVAIVFLRFSRNADKMLVCYSDAATACFGPLERQPE